MQVHLCCVLTSHSYSLPHRKTKQQKSRELANRTTFKMCLYLLHSFPSSTNYSSSLHSSEAATCCIAHVVKQELMRGAWFRGYERKRNQKYCTWEGHRADETLVLGMNGHLTQT